MFNVIMLCCLLILLIAGLFYLHKVEENKRVGTYLYVGTKEYTNKDSVKDWNFLFQDIHKYVHNSYEYHKVIFDDEYHPVFINGDILLFTDKESPENWRGHYLLVKHDGKYRIAKCTSYDTITNFPPLFDGHETPGIGYEIIGFLKHTIRPKVNKKQVIKTYF